jgi:hypothetical protein
MSQPCRACRYWLPAGLENSGIPSRWRDGNNWRYEVGSCNPPTHELDTPPSGELVPSWRPGCSAGKWRGGVQ